MLQPDLLFAYGLCSGLALSAGKKLKEEKSLWINQYYLLALLWLVVFFLGQIFYLLFKFPGWESMFVFKDLTQVPSWFLSLYTLAVVILGSLGFYFTGILLKRNQIALALAQPLWSLGIALIIIIIGWDGTGYKRLLYPGSGLEWVQGISYPLVEFFKSQVFFTLLWLEAIVLIPYLLFFFKWLRESREQEG